MTDTSDKYRALFLTAIMVLSVMVGTVAFAGGAAAAEGLTAGSSDDVGAGLASTSQVSTFTVDLVDGESTTFTIDTSDARAEGISYSSLNSASSGTPATASVTASGVDASGNITVTVTDQTASGTNPAAVTITVDANLDTTGTSAATGVTYTIIDGSGTSADVTQSFAIDATGPSITEAIEFQRSGTFLEVAMSEDVVSNGNLDDGEFDVWIDGELQSLTDGDVTYLSGVTEGSGAGGTILIALPSDVLPNQTVTVNTTTDLVDANGVPSTQGNVSATITGTTLTLSGTAPGPTISPYQGTAVAVDFQTPANTATTTNVAFERELGGSVQFSGGSGVNSQVIVFDTSGKSTTEEFRFVADTTADGVPDTNAGNVSLRDLGLTATADSTTINDRDDLKGTVSANAGSRDMEITLYDSNDEVVAEDTVTTGSSSGEATFNFGAQSTGTYYVEVQDVLSGATATTADITVEEAGDVQAGFVQNTYTTRTGDIASIAVSFQNTDTAAMTLGSEDAGYEVNVTLTDGDGDGVVTVLWNTFLAGNGSGLSTGEFDVEDNDDSISVESNPQPYPSNPVDTGTYNLDVRAGSSFGASAQAVSVVAVEDRFTNGISSWTAPEERPLSDLGEILTAADNGNLSEDDQIAIGDWLVFAVDANGLEGVLAANAGGDATARFLDGNGTAADDNWALHISQTNPRQNRGPKHLQLSSTSLTVVPDADNETYYLVIDTSQVTVRQDGAPASLTSGDKFRANFTVLKDAGFQADQQAVTDSVSVTSASISLDRDPVQVLPEQGQSVSGTSTLAPGSTVRIQLQSVNASPRFIKSTSVRVQADGTWSASFDFQNQAVGDTFDVTVTDGAGARLASQVTADGEVVSEIEEPGDGVRTVIVPSPTPAFVPVTRVVTQEVTRTVIQDRTVTVTVTQTPGQPGFGIAVAIVALLAAALLALRRRD